MSTTPRPIRASKARRRAATRAVSTERPIPGNSATAVHTPSGGGTAAGRVCATREAGAAAARTTTNAASKSDRMGSEAIARVCARQLDAASANQANYAMTFPSTLEARVAELERERKHLLAVIEILKEVSRSLHFIDILQAIARKLGEAFGLDRCSIFLAERGGRSVRLVASYEDPTIRNYVVDLERYPELKRALLSFLRRLLAAFGEREGAWAEGLLPRASSEELDRLVGVAMAVIQEEAKGR